MSDTKKILWLAHEANLSGANLCLKEFMQLAAEHGFVQLLVVPHAGNMQQVAAELNIPVFVVPFYSWTRPLHGRFFDAVFVRRLLRNTIAVVQLVKLILQQRISIVFTNTSVINIGAWAARLSDRRHYWYIHEMGEEDFGFKLPWGLWSYRFMEIFSTKVLINAEHLAKKYQSRFRYFKPEIVYNPVIVPSFYTSISWQALQNIQLLLIGQITEAKGHLHAIEAVAVLRQQGYPVLLNIVGRCEDSVYLQHITDTIAENHLQDSVQLQAFSNTPHQTIARHHILLMCSRCEAFGRVTIEAMKIGVPVVGANTCGTKEIIEDRVSGILYEQGSAQALAAAIRLLIDQPVLRQQITERAKPAAMALTNSDRLIQLLSQ